MSTRAFAGPSPNTVCVAFSHSGQLRQCSAKRRSSAKLAYNDDSPAVDGTRKYVNEISSTLGVMTNVLADDFRALGYAICARP